MRPEVHRTSVLVTGAEGFTGRILVNELEKRGFNSRHPSSRFSKDADLLDRESLADFFKSEKPSHIIHLAAISNPMHSDKDEMWAVNVLGTENLLAALERSQVIVERFVFASSSAVYAPSLEAISEESPTNPKTIYAESKLAAEEICSNYASKFNVVTVRPFNYTGLGQTEEFFVPKIVGALRRGDSSLSVGNLQVSRDFSDVRDIVRYYIAVIDEPLLEGTLNFCSGEAHKLEDVLRLARQLSAAHTHFVSDSELLRVGDNPVVLGSSDRLQAKLGVYPERSLKDTLSWMLSA